MEIIGEQSLYFVRLEPGEKLVESLRDFALQRNIKFGAIVSGVGMTSHLEIGFFSVEQNDYARRTFGEILDLSSISGNIAWRDGNPAPHVHVLVNRPSYESISGHLIEATCHITMEIFVQNLAADVVRTTAQGRPATFITRQRD